MKKLATILFVIISSLAISQADNNSSLRWGVNLDVRSTPIWFLYYQSGSSVSLFVTVNKNKHQFDFGPQIFPNSFNNGYKLGLGFQYRYFPNGIENRFNPYLSPALYYANGQHQVTLQNSNGSEIRTTKSNLGSIGGGYGIELKLTKNFYLASDIRLLYTYGRYKYTEEYTNSTQDYHYVGGLHSIDFVLGLNIGARF